MSFFQKGSQPNKPAKTEITNEARLYHKIGGYYKWSPKVFFESPWWLVKQLSAILDEAESNLEKFIGYEEVGMYKVILRLFGKKD